MKIHFGALVPPLWEQLGQNNPPVKHSPVWHWQEDADAITRLALRGLLTESQVHMARKKLVKKMKSEANNG